MIGLDANNSLSRNFNSVISNSVQKTLHSEKFFATASASKHVYTPSKLRNKSCQLEIHYFVKKPLTHAEG